MLDLVEQGRMRIVSKYSVVARNTAQLCREGKSPIEAWDCAAKEVFPDQSASRNKGCPRCAFLGLAEEGIISGVPMGKYTKSKLNKRYALKAVSFLRSKRYLLDNPDELWRLVVEGVEMRHNQQMDVVIGLWKNGDLNP